MSNLQQEMRDRRYVGPAELAAVAGEISGFGTDQIQGRFKSLYRHLRPAMFALELAVRPTDHGQIFYHLDLAGWIIRWMQENDEDERVDVFYLVESLRTCAQAGEFRRGKRFRIVS